MTTTYQLTNPAGLLGLNVASSALIGVSWGSLYENSSVAETSGTITFGAINRTASFEVTSFNVGPYQNSFASGLIGFTLTNSLAWQSASSFFGSSAPMAARLEEGKTARSCIDDFENLNENWDGYGASSISKDACDNARRFLDVIDGAPFSVPTPELSPTPSGTISFEWETPRSEVYLEIGNSRYSGFIKLDQRQTIFLQGRADSLDQQIVALIQSAVSGDPATLSLPVTEIHASQQPNERLAA